MKSVTHQINHSTRHLQNVNKCLQVSNHAFIAPTFKHPASEAVCVTHPMPSVWVQVLHAQTLQWRCGCSHGACTRATTGAQLRHRRGQVPHMSPHVCPPPIPPLCCGSLAGCWLPVASCPGTPPHPWGAAGDAVGMLQGISPPPPQSLCNSLVIV